MPHKFIRQRRKLAEPIKFVSVLEAFEPQIKVCATRDLSGWVNRDRRVKWSMGKGKVGYLNVAAAREYAAKGYVEILDGTVKPVSQDELDEMLSTITTIGPGVVANG